MITKQQAIAARHGDLFHHVSVKNADGSPARVRVNGACKTWKTRPAEFRLPYKHGLYEYGYIDHDNAHEFMIGDGLSE